MHLIDKIYINGRFVTPQGHDMFDLHNPASGEVIGQVRLGNESDADAAIAAAKAAFPAFSQTSKKQRQEMLRQLHDVVVDCEEELLAAVVEEYGGPVGVMSQWMAMAANNFTAMAEALEDYQFVRPVKSATVVMTPIGVVGAIIPWNSNSVCLTGC